MEQILKDLGLNSMEELFKWLEDNPDSPLAQSLNELIGKMKDDEYEK